MYTIFRDNVPFKILEIFVNYPNEEIHLREIARKTKSGLSSVKRYLEELKKLGIIKEYRKGKMKIFRINKSHPAFKSFQRFYWISRFSELKFEELSKDILIVGLYGSILRDYDEFSDIDILILRATKEHIPFERYHKFFRDFEKFVQWVEFRYYDWYEMFRSKKAFYFNVMRSLLPVYEIFGFKECENLEIKEDPNVIKNIDGYLEVSERWYRDAKALKEKDMSRTFFDVMSESIYYLFKVIGAKYRVKDRSPYCLAEYIIKNGQGIEKDLAFFFKLVILRKEYLFTDFFNEEIKFIERFRKDLKRYI